MSITPRSKHMTVELIVPANTTGSQVSFPDIPELRSDLDKDALIFGIRTYSADSLPKTVTGNTMCSFAQLQNAFLTLQVLGTDQIKEIPLIRLLDMREENVGYFFNTNYFELAPERIEWTKSYVSFATPPGNVAAYSYLFEVAYEWMPAGSYGKYVQAEWNKWSVGLIKV